MLPSTIELREADQPVVHRLPRAVAVGLASANIATVAPTLGADEYRVGGVRKVGVVRIAGHTVWLKPKTPVRRLFAMLGYARAGSAIWTEDDFGFEEDNDLVPALAHAFVRQASRALAGGPLRGYVTREDALPLVRGRWRIGDQLTRRGGQPLPVEVSFDDYVEDIAENQVLLTAATRLLRLPGVPADVLGALRRIVRVLDGVSVIPVGAPVPVVRPDRRNARYASTLALASLVLSGSSVEQRPGSVVASGFLVDMWSVFEDFVSAALCEAFKPYGGELVPQYASTLDVGGTVKIAPDLVWLVDGEVRACIDVKYKVEKHGQYPNADLCQMAAYCRRFGLGEGWLLYAAGSGFAECAHRRGAEGGANICGTRRGRNWAPGTEQTLRGSRRALGMSCAPATVIKRPRPPRTDRPAVGDITMAPTTKEAQRAELHKTIWRIANDLRGSVDGWDFKSYVLGMLFYRFISENLAAYIDKGEREAGETHFAYADLPDEAAEHGRRETVYEKGFYILPSELFQNVRKRAPHDPDLNETLATVFRNIEGSALGTDSEDDLKGLFDDLDVNSNKLGNTVAKRNEKLVKLLDAIGELPLGDFENHSIDLFGDAYEYLMQMYASQAGKSGGEYYTPQEVSELLAKITVSGKTRVNKVYDPAAGSGSLLLTFAKVLGKENVGGFYGQEINLTTYNLARINMFLHELNYEQFSIAHGDTLLEPAHWDDEPFEAIVSNPPYSIKWPGDADALLINDPRFAPAGVLAPKSKADLAFTMHILSWLAVNGTAAIVEFPGVLYRGGAEAKIRKYLIDNNYVDAVIQLPPDLFFGTTIATCIIVLKKSKAENSVLFLNASTEFKRSGNKNKLTPDNQQNILAAFEDRADVEHFSKLVFNEDIAANDYNIAVSSYVEAEDTRDVIDITELNAEIARIVAQQAELRSSIDEIVADLEGTA